MICVTISMAEDHKIVHSKTLTSSGHHTDRQTERQTESVIPISRNPSGARQKGSAFAGRCMQSGTHISEDQRRKTKLNTTLGGGYMEVKIKTK